MDVFDDHLEILVGSVHDDASSRSTVNKKIYVDGCSPRAGLMLTHLEFAKLCLCFPDAYAPLAAETVTGVVLTYLHPRAFSTVKRCGLDLTCTYYAASVKN